MPRNRRKDVKKSDLDVEGYGDPELEDIERPKKLDRRRQNYLNKSRSKAMERRMADYFRGKRVPMSGSGSMKGDCIVPFDDYRSLYLECKLTQEKNLRIFDFWLQKVLKESREMRCYFGFLVINFLGTGKYYCFVPEYALPKLEDQGIVIPDAPLKITVGTEWKALYSNFFDVPFFTQFNSGKWLVLHHTAFRDMLDQIPRELIEPDPYRQDRR